MKNTEFGAVDDPYGPLDNSAPAAPQAAGVGEMHPCYDEHQAGCDCVIPAQTVGPVPSYLERLSATSREPEGGAAHYGDPCVNCGVGHDNVPQGPCRGDGITISRERANALLGYLKNGSGPAGWPTTLGCEVQAFIKNIEAALATREEAQAEAGAGCFERVVPSLEELFSVACYALCMSDIANDRLRAHVKAIRSAVIAALSAQPQAREDAQPVGWLRAVDEEMVCAHLGVADAEDSFETAKKKLASLIQWNIAVATDPSVGGYPATDALRVAVEAFMPLAEVAFLWSKETPPDEEVQRYRERYWAVKEALATLK